MAKSEIKSLFHPHSLQFFTVASVILTSALASSTSQPILLHARSFASFSICLATFIRSSSVALLLPFVLFFSLCFLFSLPLSLCVLMCVGFFCSCASARLAKLLLWFHFSWHLVPQKLPVKLYTFLYSHLVSHMMMRKIERCVSVCSWKHEQRTGHIYAKYYTNISIIYVDGDGGGCQCCCCCCFCCCHYYYHELECVRVRVCMSGRPNIALTLEISSCPVKIMEFNLFFC